ncbi:alpha-amylase family glycosyl hydrolase [Hymenobacter latericus]|uniref:alpha-amylase family glycosyl hydrolase n=1 Tax=Hymenobacter sp. YIM 151858-1 TaxID=2987688 RepID=UPI002226313A|nr:alpha-amylase family glycosyl hydrolase [Hymenobacter sp. YIM 151858-1]UYZ60674.1 alpha-amylase family glycosyl hydrolase [Hymenobacter sp. YIM 151858-1]
MRKLRLLGVLWLMLLSTAAVRAQVVTTQPSFFTADDQVTLTFDATKGSGGLKDYTGDVYIWTGVISDKSANDTDWKAVVGTSFSQPIAKEKMTRSATNPNLYTISFVPRTYYDKLPATDKIMKLAMVFRGANGSPEGKDTGNKDILIEVQQSAALSVRFTAPAGQNLQLVESGAKVRVSAEASKSSNLKLFLNNALQEEANANSISKELTFTQAGRNEVKVVATDGSQTAQQTLVFFVRGAVVTQALPGGMRDGINYLPGGTSVVLVLTAPDKQHAFVLGEFNNWEPTDAGYMKKTPDGKQWWLQLDNLQAGQEYAYQYLVDGTLRIADPFTEKVLDPSDDPFIPQVTYPGLKAYPTGKTTGNVSVLQTNQAAYNWQAATYKRPAKSKLVIYELLVRDFIARHDYQTLTDTLAYLQRLGVNAIELMPVNEFEGNESWGYNTSFYFAPDKYYGPKDQLKRFIDECHRRGIAVILDMVLNHSFGESPMVQLYFENGKPTANSPWFNQDATHPFNVGYDFNHESPYTRAFSKRVMEFWLQEYKIDGYRFDLSKGFTQTNAGGDVGKWGQKDDSRIAIWKDYNNHIRTVDKDAYVILEHFADNSEEQILAAEGMMLWGNLNHNYNEATMGYVENNKSDLSWGYYGTRNWSQPNLVTYMESHDEERLMFKNISFGKQVAGYDTRNLNTALARNEAAAAFFFTVPGPKMIWQFGEVGYDVSIDENGRVGNKPIRWEYYNVPARRKLYDTYRNLISLKKNNPVFDNPSTFVQNVAGATKTIHLSDANLSVAVIGNFDVVSATVNPKFQSTGKWYNYLANDSITVTDVNAAITLQPGEYRVYTSRRLARVTSSKAAQQVAAIGLTVAPNPASSQATVLFTLPTAAPVQVSVHNIIGREVRRVALPGRQAAGPIGVKVPLAGLAPGVYLVKVQAGATAATTRLVVQP